MITTLSKHLQHGITLEGMKNHLEKLPHNAIDIVNQANSRFPLNGTINGYINQYYIAEVGKRDKLSVCERMMKNKELSCFLGQANVFVSWPLSTSIDTFLESLEIFITKNNMDKIRAYFWVCDYVIRQYDVGTDLMKLRDCVESIHHTVLLLEPWDAPELLKQVYCIKEVFHTQKLDARFDVVMSKEKRELFEHALLNDLDSTQTAVLGVDVSKAECRNTNEKELF